MKKTRVYSEGTIEHNKSRVERIGTPKKKEIHLKTPPPLHVEGEGVKERWLRRVKQEKDRIGERLRKDYIPEKTGHPMKRCEEEFRLHQVWKTKRTYKLRSLKIPGGGDLVEVRRVLTSLRQLKGKTLEKYADRPNLTYIGRNKKRPLFWGLKDCKAHPPKIVSNHAT